MRVDLGFQETDLLVVLMHFICPHGIGIRFRYIFVSRHSVPL